jgi:putative transposase
LVTGETCAANLLSAPEGPDPFRVGDEWRYSSRDKYVMAELGIKLRFYPNKEQEILLENTFGCARWVYNQARALREEAYKNNKQRISFKMTSELLPSWKKSNPWLREVSAVPLQQALRQLDRGYQNFFAKRAKYPRFRSKEDNQSVVFMKNAFMFEDGQITLAKMITPLKIIWSRQLPSSPTSITISRDRAGRWFAAFRCEHEPEKLEGGGRIGIDLGLNHLITLDDGTKIENPRHLRKREHRLRKAQRALSRKRKGSKNRAKARLRVAREHARVSDARRDHLHKLTTRLIRENQTICVENLNIKGLVRTRLAKSISDASWGEIIRQLTYKAAWYGRELVKIDRFFPSTKACSSCGVVHGSKPLSVREWTCDDCGAEHDRDVNAAMNILAAGTAVIARGGAIRPAGRQVRMAAPLKQEAPITLVSG